MYTQIAVLLLIYSSIADAQSNATVEYYVNTLESFHKQILHYQLPRDSRSFLQGKPEIQESSADGGTYDFIIVGAGSAGCVLANRLTENTNYTVLILEAGEDENIITDIPSEDRNLWLTNYNWGYTSVPQKHGMGGYVNNSITIPRGKALGGSSVINSLIYTRGSRASYDHWALEGNPGWSYDEVLPYFIKSENATVPGLDPGYYGTEGPWHVEYSRIFDKIGEAFIEASKTRDRPPLDYNGKDQMGSSIVQVNEVNGRRDSAMKAFLRPVSSRKSLTILSSSFVTKILIDTSINSAYGVQYLRNGQQYIVRAKKEVILSAGSINSPQLLMLSGIGPKMELESLNISVIQDLPVGKNMWDHLLFSFPYFTSNFEYPPLPTNSKEEREYLRENVFQYLNGEGPFTSCGAEQAIGYTIPSPINTKDPDIEIVLHAGRDSPGVYETYLNRLHYTYDTYEYIAKQTENVSAFHLHSILLHPKSRGTVKLKTNSPFDFPLIDPKYFSHKSDVTTLLESIEYILSLVRAESFKKYEPQAVKLFHPLCKSHSYGTDGYWTCMIKNLATSTHHFSGTCRMGPRWEESSVVDRFLKVHGVSKLRVVDCSVIPVTISGHTNAIAIMIAEKAADIIKTDWA